jgi:hypothetical protein
MNWFTKCGRISGFCWAPWDLCCLSRVSTSAIFSSHAPLAGLTNSRFAVLWGQTAGAWSANFSLKALRCYANPSATRPIHRRH